MSDREIPRRPSVESLARSIRQDGVLQPVVVRPHPTRKGFFEIRAGERRWRAAQAANLTHLPAIVRRLDDQSALSVTIAENMQRENLHPLEEAATIQLAFDRGFDLKAVAAELGKSVQHIARRASLTRLSETWKTEILRQDSEAERLSVAHLELIARLPETAQDLLADREFEIVFGRGFPSVAELRRVIDGGLHSLRAMPWKPDDDTLDPKVGACLQCSKRSSKQPMLFDGEEVSQDGKASKTDRCLDPVCYDNKHAAHLGRCEANLREQHADLRLVQVTYERLSPASQRTFAERVTRIHQPLLAKSKGDQTAPVMPIDGPKAGQLMHVALPQSGNGVTPNGGRRSQRPKGKDGKPVPLSMTERKARLQRRRDAYLVKYVEGVLRALTDDGLAKIARHLEREDRPKNQPPVDCLALLLAFGTSTREDRYTDTEAWPDYNRLRSKSGTVRTIKVLRELTPIWARRLSSVDGASAAAQAADAKRVCALIGLDAAAIEAEAMKAIPTPKNWGNGSR